jgi:AcrR family transcriptional regulator
MAFLRGQKRGPLLAHANKLLEPIEARKSRARRTARLRPVTGAEPRRALLASPPQLAQVNRRSAVAPTRRRLDPEVRRKEILKAATRAFATRPYDDVHIDSIARDADASRALINHYFGDKRGLFVAVAQGIVARTPNVVRTDLDLSVEDMVAANADAWLDLLEANRETSLMFLGAGPIGPNSDLEALQDELRDNMADRILANHLGTTDIPPAAHITMRAATGLMERAARDWVTGRGGTRSQTHTLIVQSILAVVRHVLPAVLAVESEEPSRQPHTPRT